jgi:hypothetical protein
MSREELESVIIDYLESADRGYTQGSDEWKSIRCLTIGGSEQATLEDKNPYANRLDLLKSKLGLKPFNEKMATKWGNMFEDVLCAVVEKQHCTKIFGGEAFLKGRYPTQSYSPDGIGVVDGADGKPEIVLFEFKCPTFRLPDNDKIPVYYKPQVMAGMDTIRLMKRAIFIEAVFRRCPLSNLDKTPTYNRDFWPKDPEWGVPIAHGFVGLKWTSAGFNRAKSTNDANRITLNVLAEHFRGERLLVYHGAGVPGHTALFNVTADKSRVTDFGSCTKAALEQMFLVYAAGNIECYYSPICYDETGHNLNAWLDSDPSSYVLGVLPYKLFALYTKTANYIEGYLDEWQPQAESIIETVRRCREDPTNMDRHIIRWAAEHMPGVPHGMADPDATPPLPTEKKSNVDLLSRIANMQARRQSKLQQPV